MPKSYRIRTQVGVDKSVKVNLEQDFDSINILSLKILQSEIYNRRCSDYGVVVGRVFANGGLGLPNARVSIFIPLEEGDADNPVITELYPYSSISDISEDGYRYNLLSSKPSYTGHVPTGTFPDREDVLLNQSYIEVFDKYYKFTTKTNESGDYMIFGIPLGSQTIFMDIDLSDMGCFSLGPQDLIQAGIATESQVNGSKFKSSTNLNELPQIKTLNKIVDIAPLWGEPEVCQLGITRVDFDLTSEANVTIKPTAVFMGSIVSTTEDDALKISCKPKVNTGNLCELVAGPGQILSIRQTVDTDDLGYPILEQYELEQNGKVIDGDGSYLVNLPMNLDYIFTNEFGEQTISNDPKVGVPTKARYRFKFKWENEAGLQNEFLRANYFVPNIKEHGWETSSYLSDPYKTGTYSNVTFNIPNGAFGQFTVPAGGGGLVFQDTLNVSNYSVEIDTGSGPQPYFGDTQVITLNAGDTIYFYPTLIDPNTPGEIVYKFLDLQFFQVLKSYSFSLDWDDYNDPEAAINCEDTFYEFHYNKVYTTAMFLDRYKNGINRARHLGIKEIDNRSCKSTVNTFPVNDIIRNFDFLFFVFNLLINILTFPLLVLLFVAHFIAWAWPVLKYLLIALGIYFAYIAIREGIDSINSILEQAAFAVPGGPIFNIGVILRIIVQVLAIIFKVGLAAAFIAFTILYLIPIENFPRIGLPMLSYPDCSSCDCKCGNADMSDANNLTTDSVNNQITAAGQSASGGDLPGGVPSSASTSTSFLAPTNDVSTFPFEHPNLVQASGYDPLDNDGGKYSCGLPYQIHRSFTNALASQYIESNLLVASTLAYQRTVSGSESLSTEDVANGVPDKKKLRAPQPFLFSTLKDSSANFRWWGYPITETYSQKLNEFNLRQKYFDGVNKIKVKFNYPEPLNTGSEHYDQVLVVLAKPGTLSQIGVGEIFSFQNPALSNCNVNITGATFYNTSTGTTTNQFSNNSLTGTSQVGTTIPIQVPYATSQTISTPITYNILNTGSSENYLSRPIDIEYFQVLTGYSYNTFMSLSTNSGGNDRFPFKYLNHNSVVGYPSGCNYDPFGLPQYGFDQIIPKANVVTEATSYTSYEVLIMVRGVDPFTTKQRNRYDLSRIFGYATENNSIVIEGEYYLNVPIQGYVGGTKPKSHNINANDNAPNLYFPSYNFRISPSYTIGGSTYNEFTGFTSTLPYYYISSDDPISDTYAPDSNIATIQTITQGLPFIPATTRGFVLPTIHSNPQANLKSTSNYNFAGGAFIGGFGLQQPTPVPTSSMQYWYSAPFSNPNGQPIYSNYTLPKYLVYSPAYYRYIGTSLPQNGVQYNVSFATPVTPQYLVMRSDRIPTSTSVDNGFYGPTGYGLHQNNHFSYYKGGLTPNPQIGVAPDINGGQQYFDESQLTQTLTSTLTCEGMVSLQCYQGTGTGISVNSNCEVPSDRVKEGCYCLLNKKYISEYDEDAKLFLEWKTRFTLTFAACRGVFAQVFQNNWINGVLYMFTFNKSTTFDIDSPNEPTYNFCRDVVLFNPINNGFYYRSSPWNGTDFIGVNSPPKLLSETPSSYPGYGYNTKRIQFPTTVMDLGPRDSFVSEICNDNDFNGYLVDQVRSTSYKDNSDVLQMGFISRILNQSVINQMLPIANPSGGNTEGKGIIQFFNSSRKAERIDGDIAQALSINSEWKVLPYLNENYPDNYLFIGDDGQNGADSRPVLGIFFSSSTEEYNYRKLMTPGVEYYSNNCNGVFSYYGYPKDQVVPHYKWRINTSTNIFGSENNNWVTTSDQNASGNGFYSQEYQNLNFDTLNEYFRTSTTAVGYITNFDTNGNPSPTPNNPDTFLVGAPFFFYFGLNNGYTAMDKFIKLYVQTEE